MREEMNPKNLKKNQMGLPLEPNLDLNPEEKTRLINRIREKRGRGEALSVTEEAYLEDERKSNEDNPYQKH